MIFSKWRKEEKAFKCCGIDFSCIDSNMHLNEDKYADNIWLIYVDFIRVLQKYSELTGNEKHPLKFKVE